MAKTLVPLELGAAMRKLLRLAMLIMLACLASAWVFADAGGPPGRLGQLSCLQGSVGVIRMAAYHLPPGNTVEVDASSGAARSGQYPPPESAPPPEQPQPARLTPEQLRQLVAPIALYPDALIAQILAASAYPTQIVEADRFLQDHPELKGKALADAVDQQDWDPSVKALTEFPSVLANMDRNLSWTSALGDANYNQPADVMAAVQYLRHQAKKAGKLQSTPQLTVTTQGDTIVIQPANPQIVYVPEYDPTIIYGYPLPLWPGLYPWWTIHGPFLSFSVGFAIGPFFAFGWGWHAWACNWVHPALVFAGRPYIFHRPVFYNRFAYFHGGFRPAPLDRPVPVLRGYGPRPILRPGPRVSALGGITRGAEARSFALRGRYSLGRRR